MFGISVLKAAEICRGQLSSFKFAEKEINRIVIDSRSAGEGDLFVAYKGDNTDGHDYIRNAFEHGAACALAEHLPEGIVDDNPIIVVENVQIAVEKIIAYFLQSLSVPVVGITGSVGKTTAKEMTASVLAEKFKVYKTEKNLNSNIGLPITMSGIPQNTELAVLELGISIPGEMDHRGAMTHPDVMIFTNIGHAHLEFLGSLEGVFKEKTKILNYMPPDGTVIINGDDEWLKGLVCRQRILSYGIGRNCQVRAENIVITKTGCVEFDIRYEDRILHVVSNTFGRHMIYASLIGACAGFIYGLSDKQILKGIESYQIEGRRGVVTDTGYLTLIDDCYNSNFESCRMAIDSLMDLNGRHVCILGDILELGDSAVEQHKLLGDYAKIAGVELIIGVGNYGSYISDCFYNSKNELIAALPKLIKKGDTVLVKASHGIHLEEISDILKQLSE